MFNSSPFAQSKRSREEAEEGSPSGKRCRTFQPIQAVEQPQQAPPTANFASTLAQQQQAALERMEFGAAEKEDTEMDAGNMSDESTTSNPRHPWNVAAPAMAHQASSNSLSNSSVASSSMPGTPLDGSFNYTTMPNYPSNTNPTSFTDMNGTTHTFHSSTYTSNAPPPPAPPTTPSGPVSHGYLAQAYANQAKLQESQQQHSAETTTMMPTEEEQAPKPIVPSYGYGWDYPRQSNAFSLGGHLV